MPRKKILKDPNIWGTSLADFRTAGDAPPPVATSAFSASPQRNPRARERGGSGHRPQTRGPGRLRAAKHPCAIRRRPRGRRVLARRAPGPHRPAQLRIYAPRACGGAARGVTRAPRESAPTRRHGRRRQHDAPRAATLRHGENAAGGCLRLQFGPHFPLRFCLC